MQRTFYAFGVLVVCLFAEACFAQSKPVAASICGLQEEVSAGDHMNVRVSGVYSFGVDEGVLENTACPNQSIWIELALQSEHNKNKLERLIHGPGRAYVVFEGELYGSPLPDPKLPEAIRKVYHPGWGHMGAFKTKLVVHVIREAAETPPSKP
jgi:hypothetical protein